MPLQQQTITTTEQQQLHTFYNSQYPHPSQRECIKWFEQLFGHSISQPACSLSLGPCFTSLDTAGVTRHSDTQLLEHPNTQRCWPAQWPALEAMLIEWQLLVEAKDGVTSGCLLQVKAKEVWAQFPEHTNKPVLDFSNSWLQKFQQ